MTTQKIKILNEHAHTPQVANSCHCLQLNMAISRSQVQRCMKV